VPLNQYGVPEYIPHGNIKTIISSSTEEFDVPAISVNDYDTAKFTISGAKRAFASFNRSVEQPKIKGARLTCSGSNETWELTDITQRNNSSSPDTTFRAFATPRFSFVNGADIFTNTEHVQTVLEQTNRFTRITANSGNLMDIFLIYSHGPDANNDYTLEIRELDP